MLRCCVRSVLAVGLCLQISCGDDNASNPPEIPGQENTGESEKAHGENVSREEKQAETQKSGKTDSEAKIAGEDPSKTQPPAEPAIAPELDNSKPMTIDSEKRAVSWTLTGADNGTEWKAEVTAISVNFARVNILEGGTPIESQVILVSDTSSNIEANGRALHLSTHESRGTFGTTDMSISLKRDNVTGACQVDYLLDGFFSDKLVKLYGICLK